MGGALQAVFPAHQGNTWTAKWTSGVGVMGSQDHIFFGSAAEKFARAQKNMRLAVIENCGHVCSIEAPELFNDLFSSFLSGQEVPLRVTANPSSFQLG